MNELLTRVRGRSRATYLAGALVIAMAMVGFVAPLRATSIGEPIVLRPDRFVAIPVERQLPASARSAVDEPMGALSLRRMVPFDAALIGEPIEQTAPRRIVYPSFAAAAAEFRPRARVPAGIPEHLQGEPRVTLFTASSASYALDLPKMQRVLAENGLPDLQLPTTMHGAKVTVDVPAALSLSWGSGSDALVLTQMRQPKVTVPPEVQLPTVRELLLSHPVVESLHPSFIGQVRSIERWQTTMPVPVPEGATAEEVRVDGADGLLLTYGDHGLVAVAWQRNGVLYSLAGRFGMLELLAVADSLS